MASAPSENNLPMFYKELVPLNSKEHAKWSTRSLDDAKFMEGAHAIPLTTEEFVMAGRNYPIIFSAGDNPVPLALMGLNEGVNIFMDEKGKFTAPVYIPAYVRRYPFLLARLQADSDELSLCFDPTSKSVGNFKKDALPLFDGEKTSENTQNILKFCEDFENAGAQTQAFMDELQKADLLMEGEVSIQQADSDKPFVYRGFKMVDEQKIRDMTGDKLRKINQNGMLPLIHAHLFSLQLMRDIFAQQVQQGKVPEMTEVPTT
mgnify:CR=1 FL=1